MNTKNLGLRIKQAREQHKMTQEELASSVGYSVDHISVIERGIKAPRLDKLIESYTANMFLFLQNRNCSFCSTIRLDFVLTKTFHPTSFYIPTRSVCSFSVLRFSGTARRG